MDENGIEYWEARELMPILGYEKWQTAEDVIARAARATVNSGQDVENHFTKVSKMVKIGSVCCIAYAFFLIKNSNRGVFYLSVFK